MPLASERERVVPRVETRVPVRGGEPRVFAFDLETTGLDMRSARIVEFCFVELDAELRPLAEPYCKRVQPGVPIPPDATRVHGIGDADVASEPRFSHYAPRIQRLVQGATLVAYNHEFDRAILHRELVDAGEAGLAIDQSFIDPYLIFRERDPQYTLDNAVRFYLRRAFREDGKHSAPGDVHAMVEVLREQRARHGLGSASALVVGKGRRWLDWDRKLYRDEEGVARFGFGKHEGRAVRENAGYLDFILRSDFSEDTKRAARELRDELAKRA